MGSPGFGIARMPGRLFDAGNAPGQPVGDGVIQGNAVQGIVMPAFAHCADQAVKGAVLALVGADDTHLAAPLGHGNGGRQQVIELITKGRLIDNDNITWLALGAQYPWV